MIQLTSPFRPHRAKNQSPVNRRATLLGARVSSVEAEPEKAAQAFGLTAATGQATVTVVICESRSGVLLGTWPLKGIWALPVKKDESRGLRVPAGLSLARRIGNPLEWPSKPHRCALARRKAMFNSGSCTIRSAPPHSMNSRPVTRPLINPDSSPTSQRSKLRARMTDKTRSKK